MNKKAFAYGDQHLKLTGSFLPYNNTGITGLSLQLENVLRGFKAVADEIKRVKPAFVVNLGDVFENYDVIPVQALHAAGVGMELINKACEGLGIPHFIIMGNHDCISLNPIITSLTVFSNDICTVLTKPQQMILAGKRIGFLPFCDSDNLIAGWEQMASCDYIFSHNEFTGARYESGRESNNGVTTPEGPTIISGHIHLPQIVKNAYFPGALVQNKFVERGELTYGMCSIDLDTREVQFIRNTLSKHYVLCTSVDEALKHQPKEVLIKLYSAENREEVAAALADYTYMQKKPPQNREVVEGAVDGEAQHEVHEPDDLLREFVTVARPEAMEILTGIIGGAQ